MNLSDYPFFSDDEEVLAFLSMAMNEVERLAEQVQALQEALALRDAQLEVTRERYRELLRERLRRYGEEAATRVACNATPVQALRMIPLAERMPDPEVHSRVLVYTEGTDFNGEQFFDITAESLNECRYADPADQPEVCPYATHWLYLSELVRPLPLPAITSAMILRASQAHDSNWVSGCKDLYESMRRALLAGFAQAYGIPPEATEEAHWPKPPLPNAGRR